MLYSSHVACFLLWGSNRISPAGSSIDAVIVGPPSPRSDQRRNDTSRSLQPACRGKATRLAEALPERKRIAVESVRTSISLSTSGGFSHFPRVT